MYLVAVPHSTPSSKPKIPFDQRSPAQQRAMMSYKHSNNFSNHIHLAISALYSLRSYGINDVLTDHKYDDVIAQLKSYFTDIRTTSKRNSHYITVCTRCKKCLTGRAIRKDATECWGECNICSATGTGIYSIRSKFTRSEALAYMHSNFPELSI